MATLTFEELQKKHNTKPKVMFSMEDLQRNKQVNQATQGNQFEPTETTGFLEGITGGKVGGGKIDTFFGKARDFATSVVGGGELAKGIGMSIAAPEIYKQQAETNKQTTDLMVNLLKEIRKNKQAGLPTDRLENAYKDAASQLQITEDQRKDFLDALPTTNEVIGSAVRLGSTLVAPSIVGKAIKATALGKGITGVTSGVLRGTGVGALGGGIEGGLQGIGAGIEKQKGGLSDLNVGDVLKSGAVGAGIGMATGGALGGLTGGIKGFRSPEVPEEDLLARITPKPEEMTPTQYKKALAQGLVTPKTKGSPAQYVLPDAQKQVALKFSDILDKDPTQTTLNINTKLGELDDEVGDFLRKNNGIFSKGELRNALNSALDDITDVNVSDEKLAKIKTSLVDNFVKSIETNDMESLWQARKEFDQTIQNAFKGSYSLQKDAQTTFRNAVQDYISQRTGNGTYKEYMGDMSNLFRLRDTVMQKATKERALSGYAKWAKDNPKLAKTLGWGALLTAGAYAGDFLGISGGKGDSN